MKTTVDTSNNIDKNIIRYIIRSPSEDWINPPTTGPLCIAGACLFKSRNSWVVEYSSKVLAAAAGKFLPALSATFTAAFWSDCTVIANHVLSLHKTKEADDLKVEGRKVGAAEKAMRSFLAATNRNDAEKSFKRLAKLFPGDESEIALLAIGVAAQSPQITGVFIQKLAKAEPAFARDIVEYYCQWNILFPSLSRIYKRILDAVPVNTPYRMGSADRTTSLVTFNLKA